MTIVHYYSQMFNQCFETTKIFCSLKVVLSLKETRYKTPLPSVLQLFKNLYGRSMFAQHIKLHFSTI